MIPKTVERSAIFAEFSDAEKENWFKLTRAKVLPHFDNIYYSVFIFGDSGEQPPEGVTKMLEELRDAKHEKVKAYGNDVVLWGLDLYPSNYATYEYRLSCEENFDIFISSYLPNDETPRIQVQIRSRLLVMRGLYNAMRDTWKVLAPILSAFGLTCSRIRENRIDYAYHSNLIQNPMQYFSDKDLTKRLKTSFRTGQKVFNIRDDELGLSYIALGNRKSNCLFFRAYNKSREVCEKAYKSFFLDRWVQHGLISRYDYECYLEAYRNKSYDVGLLIGRIRWYLKYGKDEERKVALSELLDTCYVKNCNSDEIKRRIKGVLPEVTVVFNCEFETKRKFYMSLGPWLDSYANVVQTEYGLPDVFRPMMRIFDLQQSFHEYLTTNVVCFVQDKHAKFGDNNPMLDWWYRIHSLQVAGIPALPDFKRCYNTQPDLLRAKKSFMSSTAYLTMLLKESVESQTFVEDISDVLANFNDNDFYGFACDQNGEVHLQEPAEYREIRKRKEFKHRKDFDVNKEEDDT